MILHNVILYSKGWYKTHDIWEDLKRCLICDGYADWMNQDDILYIIVNACKQINMPVFTDLNLILRGISEKNCFKHGLFTQNNAPEPINKDIVLHEYNVELASIMYLLSNLRHCPNEHFGGFVAPPDYENCLPKPDNITDARVDEYFKNSRLHFLTEII